ncbi:O-antigen ligase [Micromonospora pallida]|uniref:O-antigen ligase n=1 Tax=Micromonospora pallida TaxID=145854 RepID=A0A1C6SQR2_9ACTN|nr:O-antigen ligase family protein [Micromonospora pallida]SCL31934.1 O-antigen ligase [Micromonospora pallida]
MSVRHGGPPPFVTDPAGSRVPAARAAAEATDQVGRDAEAPSDLRVGIRDVALVLPLVAFPAATALDASRVLTDLVAPVAGGIGALEHLLLYLDLAAVAVLIVVTWAARGFRAPAGALPFLVLFLSFLPGFAMTSIGGYQSGKALQMVTTTPAFVVATLLVVDRPARRVALLWASAGTGVLVALLAMVRPDPAAQAFDTVVLAGTVSITTARLIGYGVVGLLCLGVLVRRLRLVALLGAVALAVPLLMTGSRGPLVALALAGLVLAVTVGGARRWQLLPPLAGLGGIIALTVATALPEGLTSRFSVLWGGPLDASAEVRVMLSGLAAEVFLERPLGVGWGGFGAVVPGGSLIVLPGLEDAIYPHNLPLEVAVEGGLVALAGLVLLAVAVVRVLWAHRTDPSVVAAATLLTFAFVNSLFSADLNGNYLVWVFAAAVLAARGRAPRRSDPVTSRAVDKASARPAWTGVPVSPPESGTR